MALGEIVLAASALRTTSGTTNGTTFHVGGLTQRVMLVLDVTALGVNAGDKLNVYVDVSPDGSKWMNACHFGELLGNAGAGKTEFAILDPSNPGTSTVLTTADAAVSTVRPGVFGTHMRARWAITDAGGATQTFTFSVKAYIQ